MTTSTAITKSQFHQVVGLLTLAKNHNDLLKEIEVALAELLGLPADDDNSSYFGFVTDAVYGEYAPEKLLRLLKIEVAE